MKLKKELVDEVIRVNKKRRKKMKLLDAFSGHLSTWIDKDFARNNVIKNDIRNGESKSRSS